MRHLLYCGIFALVAGIGIILAGLFCPVNGDYQLLDRNLDASQLRIVNSEGTAKPLKLSALGGDGESPIPATPGVAAQPQTAPVSAPTAQQPSADSLESLSIPDVFLEDEKKKPETTIPDLPGIDAFHEKTDDQQQSTNSLRETQTTLDQTTPTNPGAASQEPALTNEPLSLPQPPALPEEIKEQTAPETGNNPKNDSPVLDQPLEQPPLPTDFPHPETNNASSPGSTEAANQGEEQNRNQNNPTISEKSSNLGNPQKEPETITPPSGFPMTLEAPPLPNDSNATGIQSLTAIPEAPTESRILINQPSSLPSKEPTNTTPPSSPVGLSAKIQNEYRSTQPLSREIIPADLESVGESLTLPAPSESAPSEPSPSATEPSVEDNTINTQDNRDGLPTKNAARLNQPEQKSLQNGDSARSEAEPTHSSQIVKKTSSTPTDSQADSQADSQKTSPADSPTTPAATSKPTPDPSTPSSNGSLGVQKNSSRKTNPKTQTLPKKIKVQTASFDKITPGVTTQKVAIARLGEPTNTMTDNQIQILQYSRQANDNISEIQLMIDNEKVVSLIAQFRQSSKAEELSKTLHLSELIPVLVSNPSGIILGQAYPERGISFAFVESSQPGKSSFLVDRLILEPIQAEPFVLRAETLLVKSPFQAEADLKQALSLSPEHAHAHWLYARLLASNGNLEHALDETSKAVELAPVQPRYMITLAQVLGQTGQTEEAIAKARQAIALSEGKEKKTPHLEARSWCLTGDLIASQETPDYVQALDCHTKAIHLADAASRSPIPAIANTAQEVLVDAHLGAAHDIAWGNWNQKAASVARWLKQAHTFTEQMLAARPMSEREQAEQRLRVAMRSLSACAGVGKDIDPSEWALQVVEYGDSLIQQTDNSNRKHRISWDVGMSVYDAVQLFQARQEEDQTIQYGHKAVEYMESAINSPLTFNATDYYILGRLYFRMGAIYAINHGDHKQAVVWYRKSLPMFEKMTDDIQRIELGRLGETLVSMGVSFWEVKQPKQAITLTESGIMCLEQAVQEGLASAASLEIPYRNLSMMLDSMGKKNRSREYLEKADAIHSTMIR